MSNSGGLIRSSAPLNTGKLINAYYLEIEYLLERVEGATTHYQTLGVERAANNEEVILAYQKAVTVLHPSYHKVRAAVPDEMLVRVDQAFKKVSQAFSVLTNSKQRNQYDGQSRTPRSYATLPLDLPKLHPQARTSEAQSKKGAASDNKHVNAEAVQINVASEMRPVFTTASAHQASDERRRCERFKLTVPVLIAGYDCTGGKWQEVTKTIDVSRIGVALRMQRRLKHGLVVHITLPLPTKLRSHGFSEAGYNMYAIVRRVEPLIDGMRVVGLEFIGANPPTDYLYKPWATFRTQKWNGHDRRREPREKRAETVAVEYLDESMQRITREAGVTENVSQGGARVCVKAVPPEFEFVRITSPNRSFNSLALVRNQWSGTDGFERLCLQFVDQKWPM
jgi:curved DNA-binding protein CbpA